MKKKLKKYLNKAKKFIKTYRELLIGLLLITIILLVVYMSYKMQIRRSENKQINVEKLYTFKINKV